MNPVLLAAFEEARLKNEAEGRPSDFLAYYDALCEMENPPRPIVCGFYSAPKPIPRTESEK